MTNEQIFIFNIERRIKELQERLIVIETFETDKLARSIYARDVASEAMAFQTILRGTENTEQLDKTLSEILVKATSLQNFSKKGSETK